MKAVCVFGGARSGRNPAYGNAAEKLGALIAQRGCALVYGGGSIGLMGRVATARSMQVEALRVCCPRR